MKTAGWNIAATFATKYPHSRPRLENWRKHVQDATWKEPMDVIRTFNNASYIPAKKVWVFNIGPDRLIAMVDFVLDTVLVKQLMTHHQYIKWSNKN